MNRLLISLAFFGLILALPGCTDPQAAQNALDNFGFKDIKITGYRIFTCGEDYTFHTGFEAKNPNGKTVTGAVCSGLFKGTSVKFD